LHIQVVALSGDITAAEAPATIAEALKAEFGRVDVLVNNAGAQQQQCFLPFCSVFG
jgi:NAD(P)-dependent dehydrogenase (short-subunit alcohol dehydrogenase family)